MTAFVVVACLVALSLGFFAGFVVGLLAGHRDGYELLKAERNRHQSEEEQ